MATLRQYFDTDFSSAIRLHISFRLRDIDIEGALLYEMAAANFLDLLFTWRKQAI
jgi:hypothetical protein